MWTRPRAAGAVPAAGLSSGRFQADAIFQLRQSQAEPIQILFAYELLDMQRYENFIVAALKRLLTNRLTVRERLCVP